MRSRLANCALTYIYVVDSIATTIQSGASRQAITISDVYLDTSHQAPITVPRTAINLVSDKDHEVNAAD